MSMDGEGWVWRRNYDTKNTGEPLWKGMKDQKGERATIVWKLAGEQSAGTMAQQNTLDMAAPNWVADPT
jgi:hypothetical protein